MRDRLVGRRRKRAGERAGWIEPGAHALDPAALAAWPRPRMTSTARAASSVPATQSEMAPVRMSAAGSSAMSSMFTPSRPSASAISATTPGSFWTVTLSSVSVAARSGALQQTIPRLARARLPLLDGAGITRAEEIRRLAEALDRAVDLVGQGFGVGREDVLPDRGVRAGHPRRVAKAPSDLRAGARPRPRSPPRPERPSRSR